MTSASEVLTWGAGQCESRLGGWNGDVGLLPPIEGVVVGLRNTEPVEVTVVSKGREDMWHSWRRLEESGDSSAIHAAKS